ncbi:Uncharacterised protein [Vibrio cholerae]|nr:Uncharacterised protein [Vibrio cholerae]
MNTIHILMHMATQNGFHITVLGDDIPKTLALFECVLIKPSASHQERMMVQQH